MWYPRRQPSINLLHVDGKILLLFMTELVSTIITWFYFLHIKNPEFISNTGIPVRLVLGHASRKIHIMKDARCYLWGVKFVLNGRSLIRTFAFATDVIGNACICQKRLLSMISWLRHMKGNRSNASCFSNRFHTSVHWFSAAARYSHSQIKLSLHHCFILFFALVCIYAMSFLAFI